MGTMRPSVSGAVVLAVLFGCAPATDSPVPVPETRTETMSVSHGYSGGLHTITFLPDALGPTYITADGEVLSASGPPTARLTVSGGGLTRKDYFGALRVVADVCRTRTEFACRAFARDNGGPIFVGGQWLFQFPREGAV